MALKQYNVTGGKEYDQFSYMDHYRCGLLAIAPTNAPKVVKIIDAESYAIDPNGVRRGIATEPHDYDLRPENEGFYVRDRVYLIDAKGKRLKSNWKDGPWKFHFVMDTPTGRDVRDFDMQLGTFHYNPVVHGPPN